MEKKKRVRKPLTPDQKAVKMIRDMAYNKEHITKRVIDFNKNSDRDMKILGHLDSQTNKSKFVKDLIENNMDKGGK